MNTIEKTVKNIASIIQSKDLKEFKGNFLYKIMKAIISLDAGEAVDIVVDTAQFIYQMPNMIFWDKMERFLYGTYYNFEDQIRMASKFSSDTEYIDFTKRQIHLINQMNDDKKLEYFASLSRAVLLDLLDLELYFKLSDILTRCTREELEYLKNNYTKNDMTLNIYIDSFINVGLAKMTRLDVNGQEPDSRYCFTPLAEKLDKFALSFNDEKYSYESKDQYSEVQTLETQSSLGWEIIN